MPHSFTKIHVHLIWSTKERSRFLTGDVGRIVRQHILDYCAGKGIMIKGINIQPEHIHVLIALSGDQKIDEVVKLIKGESSHWINSQNVVRPKFSWQRGFAAFSVSPSHVDRVKKYIRNQDVHHRRKPFGEELKNILVRGGFAISETDESV